MNKIVFYEKTGCKGNARQKAILEAAGYTLEVKSILSESWDRDVLRSFFGNQPIANWFNHKAPAIKQGEIDPNVFDAQGALSIMLREPIFIRRPLLKFEGKKTCGFDESVLAMLGIDASAKGLEACQNTTEQCD